MKTPALRLYRVLMTRFDDGKADREAQQGLGKARNLTSFIKDWESLVEAVSGGG